MAATDVGSILEAARQGAGLEPAQVVRLLGLDSRGELQQLFAAAREVRQQYFGAAIFLYGFLYTSTFCRNECNFCFFRRPNVRCQRYRKSPAEAVEIAGRLADSGVHLIDLTMGEDPRHFRDDGRGFDVVIDLVRRVKETAGLPVMVSPGVVPAAVLSRLRAAGADWYACYQETHNRRLFAELRPRQNYEARLQAKVKAHELGLLIEEGVLGGVGETLEDLAESVAVMRELDADQVRMMTFVPQAGTPMETRPQPAVDLELKYIAVLRLAFPDRLIPASLDVDGIAGLEKRLAAGANVVTSIVPPGRNLAGVAQSSLDIEEGRRTAEQVTRVLDHCGLRRATNAEYRAWLDKRRARTVSPRPEEQLACS